MTELQRFRSCPQVVEAAQWTGNDENDIDAILELVGDLNENREVDKLTWNHDTLMLLAGKDGAQGRVSVPVGHWFVRNPGDPSDVWPVADPFFRVKYELIEDD